MNTNATIVTAFNLTEDMIRSLRDEAAVAGDTGLHYSAENVLRMLESGKEPLPHNRDVRAVLATINCARAQQ